MSLPHVAVLLAAASFAAAVLPDYIPVCRRDEPDLPNCVKKAIEKMRPKLLDGIPELDVPAMEPLQINEFIIRPPVPGHMAQAVATNLKVRGLGKFKINSLSVDVPGQQFSGSVYIPRLSFESDYSFLGKMMGLTMKGKGQVAGNATECRADFTLKGRLVKRKAESYMQFYDTDVSIYAGRVFVHMEGLVSGDIIMGDDTKAPLEDRSPVWPFVKPVLVKTIEDAALELANNVASHFTYDELFPAQ